MTPVLNSINPIAVSFGPFEIHWYGIIIATGVLIAVYLALKEARARNVSEDDLLNMILWALPFSIIGARIYYVAFEWPYYAKNPGEIIKVWHGGIAIYGGLIAAILVFLIYCRRHHLSIWLILDIAAPTVLIAQAIGRWGNFMNQEAFGAKTSLSFLNSLHLPNWIIQQMLIDGSYRQPTFLYESLWSFIGFIIIMSIRHLPNWFKEGEIFLMYVMWYSFGRFFVEGMRTDSLYLTSTIRVSQLLSIILFVGAIICWIWRRKNPDVPEYLNV